MLSRNAEVYLSICALIVLLLVQRAYYVPTFEECWIAGFGVLSCHANISVLHYNMLYF
jgi:hypothetical protein